MSKQFRTDQEVVAAIRGSQRERNAALKHLFSETDWYHRVSKIVFKQGGDENMAKEVFTETLMELDKNIRSGNFRAEARLKTYYLSIVSNYHLRKRRKNKRYTDSTPPPSTDSVRNTALRNLLSEDQRKYLNLLFSKIGERCQMIMELRHNDYAYREIAATLDSLNSEAAARREYARCKERIQKLIQQDPAWKTILNQLRWH